MKTYLRLFVYVHKTMGGVEAVIVSYETRGDRFESRGERNAFYRGLLGYRQTVRRNDRVYRYDKDGVLDRVPHLKVADSVFLVPREAYGPLEEYLDEWGRKVAVRTFTVTVEDEDAARLRQQRRM